MPTPAYFKKLRPSHKRRCRGHDYLAPGNYCITVMKGAGTPFFSSVSKVKVFKGDYNEPAGLRRAGERKIYIRHRGMITLVELTDTGLLALRHLREIERNEPRLKVGAFVIMPDHIHFIITVTARLDRPLWKEITAFMAACTREWHQARHTDQFFQAGFNDRICKREGQLEIMARYIFDNPRRYLLKKENRIFFTRRVWQQENGKRFATFGNHFLLDHPEISVVRWSSKFAFGEFERRQAENLEVAAAGGVLVSPFVHPLEKEIRDRGIELGASLIVIVDEGFSERFKPQGFLFELCEQGRLLLVGPEEYTGRKPEFDRRLALNMNAMAERIAAHAQRLLC